MSLKILEGLAVGEYGKAITVTLVDSADAAVDVSGYTTLSVVCRLGKRTLTEDASYTTDGTDGKVTFSFEDGDLRIPADWRARVHLAKTGELTKSDVFIIRVED
jgi:hypothetical protein